MKYLIPSTAGFFSKVIALGITFPLEYMATRNQGAEVNKGQIRIWNGFGYTLYRELIYSTIFWTFQEHMYQGFKPRFERERSAYLAASFLSSLVGATVSYPFDLFKTWKITYPEKFDNASPVSLAREIVKAKGYSNLLLGKTCLI